jgi:gamma-glutamyltranspeptidase/glutathione hydrolase
LLRKTLGLVLIIAIATSVATPASRRPVLARRAMVVSAEPLATQVGLSVLERGGNAVDAAVATALALGVTEGYSCGLGGGCFILIRMATGEAIAVDGREMAPARATRDMYIPRDSLSPADLSTTGVLAAGVPGHLAALDLALKTYGRLTLAQVIEGAIALADTGFPISMFYWERLDFNRDKLAKFPATKSLFFTSDTSVLAWGDRLVQKDLAATLRAVQKGGVDTFYSGPLPQMIVDYVKGEGGILSTEDFTAYRPRLRTPVQGTYHGLQILSMPPPSSGGIHLIEMLNILEGVGLAYLGAGGVDATHAMAEAMSRAFADRATYLGDPDFAKVPTEGLISKEYAAQLRAGIQRWYHTKPEGPGIPPGWVADTSAGQTTHLCVLDEDGNAVSLTATINTAFGSGVVVPGTGILLNNEMDDFVTNPDVPNYFGLVGSEANEIVPGKRPLSSMTPTIVAKDEKPYLVVGSPGGPRIITTVLQVIVNITDHGMGLQAAMDYPRIHQQWLPNKLYLEDGFSSEIAGQLRQRGHTIACGGLWGGATAIMVDRERGLVLGATDSRMEGAAFGY